jgi:hypothetical protein
MRVIVVSLISLFIARVPAHAETVWNVTVKAASGSTQLTSIDGNPNIVFTSCRCVAGVWRLGGETATHFVGTVAALSFNHPHKAGKSIRAKIRKTRALMGVHTNYRSTLHNIMRGSGQLVLREVAGGEWEVAGFAGDAVGDLFKAHASWRADPKRPPKPGQAAPLVDAKLDAASLAALINDYRASIKLPRVPISPAMTKVAQAHAHDLDANKPIKDGCNMHSWSAKGSWSACCYDSSREAARCMWKKPKEIAGYQGNGYEIAANASGITPEQALSLWQNSPAHHAVMINKDQWKKPWRALGVAVEGDYAVAWFGEESD